ncbi:pyridoxal-phosphate dependent enzyme [Azospirillum canadense]|uniref:pyridoxal-phosphate dependent enzyme n=1 Tax=Azospirillum canadense TaxID=403962 RepID=UPI0022269A1C|nr:pyridoxal-phosphate dependent enzyme [Azospirillum canadense]MCW2239389.1 cysteine synthase [Azospirillum canadense]
MNPFQLPASIIDHTVRDRTVRRLREAGVRLPTFMEMADPVAASLVVEQTVDPDSPDPANLRRVHWHNAADRRHLTETPGYLELPSALTGVPARILVVLGERFPMIGAHKVLPAYACLVVRLVSGLFDPARDKAVWPSTGNYCRGGVAISRILGCRGIAVLPEGMSAERFDWLARWVADPADVIRTPGSESNVKEIYDTCAELARHPDNDVINQFSEFPNYVVHRICTGRALAKVFEHAGRGSSARLAAFVSSTGSAGTLAAGDHLKATYGARIVAVEPVGCPTMLYNGYGVHNIQGIGDKHIPLIQNVMNSDMVVGVSDLSTDTVNVLFNTPEGRAFLAERKGLSDELIGALGSVGISGIANILAAIKAAKRLDLTQDDVIVTVATDGAAMYGSERDKALARDFGNRFDQVAAAEVFGRALAGVGEDHVLELGHRDRQRIFNLGYFTWVEQQGIPLADFDQRRQQRFWDELCALVPVWDELIESVNRDAGTGR